MRLYNARAVADHFKAQPHTCLLNAECTPFRSSHSMSRRLSPDELLYCTAGCMQSCVYICTSRHMQDVGYVLHLQANSPTVQQGGEPLPTFDQFQERGNSNKAMTVRDVWGLMLTAVPGAQPSLVSVPSVRSSRFMTLTPSCTSCDNPCMPEHTSGIRARTIRCGKTSAGISCLLRVCRWIFMYLHPACASTDDCR